MNKYGKEYEPFQIFEQIQAEEASHSSFSGRQNEVLSFEEAPYYEIEYDAGPVQDEESPGVPGAVSISGGKMQEGAGPSGGSLGSTGQADAIGPVRIRPDGNTLSEKDEVRELFNRMRDIAREDRYLNFRSSKFYDQRMQRENAKTFYKQGMFMKDFEDEYDRMVPYSAYFPNYQMMGYDQLRTYFSWRTQVRRGRVEHLSLSYAFLYIYELLNNIGVDGPEEGLGELLFFWDAFRVYDASVDKYVLRWLKDYHIYYELPQSFPDFVEENGLQDYYPELSGEEEHFDSYCAIARYDIRKSSFYTEERADMIRRCFHFTISVLREALLKGGYELDSLLYQPARSMSVWLPFKGALFYPALRQRDRQVRLSRKEVYVCSRNEWTCSAMITAESGRWLMGYVLKQMEATLRKVTKFKYKLSANSDMLSPGMADELKNKGILPEKIVTDAVLAFYKEETKTVVRVNPGMLEKIRQEAYMTQERLIVPEEEAGNPVYGETPPEEGSRTMEQSGYEREDRITEQVKLEEEKPNTGYAVPENGNGDGHAGLAEKDQVVEPAATKEGQNAEWIVSEELTDEWGALRNSLTEQETKALRIILNEKLILRQYADEQGIMLEVLAEGINEKAADAIGDGLLDNDFSIYEDYVEQVKEMLEQA